MSRDTSTDHVVMEGNTITCLHCGDRYQIGVPCPLRIFVVISSTYADMHRDCRKPEPTGAV